MPLTLYDIFVATASVEADRKAVVDGDRAYSYDEVTSLISEHIAALKQAGIESGDVVAFSGPPSIGFLVSLLAAARMSLVWVGINPKYTQTEVEHVWTVARPKALVCDSHSAPQVAQVLADSTGTPRLQAPSIRADLEPNSADKDTGGYVEPVAYLVFTSGTTGKPKAACLTHKSVIHAAELYALRYGPHPLVSLCNLPVNHVGCVVDIVSSTIATRGTLIFQREFNPSEIGPLVQKHSITAIGQVPAMWRMIAAEQSFWSSELKTLKHIVWSGAAMGRSLIDKLSALDADLSTCYGMTEATGSVTFTAPYASLDLLEKSVGHPAEANSVRLHDGLEVIKAVGKEGEVQLKTPMLFSGYLEMPQATVAAHAEGGWYKTGDIGVWLEDGSLCLVGRSSEMYKSGGYNVYPREIESVLERLRGVSLACVVPGPDSQWDEVGHAFIVPSRPDAALDLKIDTLRTAARKNLANYKVPKHFHIRHQLPMLPSGKVDRRTLLQEVRSGITAHAE
jgi:acyl-CoA synthetase (AMP-forming)/AMP-acid ligase II